MARFNVSELSTEHYGVYSVQTLGLFWLVHLKVRNAALQWHNSVCKSTTVRARYAQQFELFPQCTLYLLLPQCT